MAQLLSVQVRTGEIRQRPSFLGKIVARVSYGERVTKIGEKGSWVQVKPPGGHPAGWIHNSAVTTKKIVFQAGAKVGTSADSSEVALAGKGFNQQVENAYRQKNRQLDFKTIDKMEHMTISIAEIERFIKNGGLKPAGGA